MPNEPMVAHSVFFSLADSSPKGRQQCVAACREYLTGHPGTVYFAVGTLAEDIRWPVSDRGFDVALHVVFRDKAAHDTYIEAPRHSEFLDKYEAAWKEIRVFDAYVEV